MGSFYHTSVLLKEAIDGLEVVEGKKYIDATLGGAGHTFEILKRGGIVLGIDQDTDAIEEAKTNLKFEIENLKFTVVYGNFANLLTIARDNGFGKVAGILFDIGVSSHQFNEEERGFSFQYDSPLDMRMDKNLSVTAADLVNGLTKGELIELFVKYAEEKFANRIAERISKEREIHPITTTAELATLVARSYPVKGKTHPATKVFQALRIAVNDELNVLKSALPQAVELLEENGRLVIISFHSLEDRIVKKQFLEFEERGLGKIITDKPIQPRKEEIKENKRSRSAKMRIFEKN